jgi:hypothetical protein
MYIETSPCYETLSGQVLMGLELTDNPYQNCFTIVFQGEHRRHNLKSYAYTSWIKT